MFDIRIIYQPNLIPPSNNQHQHANLEIQACCVMQMVGHWGFHHPPSPMPQTKTDSLPQIFSFLSSNCLNSCWWFQRARHNHHFEKYPSSPFLARWTAFWSGIAGLRHRLARPSAWSQARNLPAAWWEDGEISSVPIFNFVYIILYQFLYVISQALVATGELAPREYLPRQASLEVEQVFLLYTNRSPSID